MRIRIITLVAALLVAVVPSAALAQTDEAAARDVITDARPLRDLSGIKERALEAIDRRLETIARLQARIDASEHLTGAHHGRLTAELVRHQAGLEQLAREIEAAETLAELRAAVPEIVTEHRIYVLVVPKVGEVIASDAGVAFARRGEEVAARLAGWIERVEAAGFDVTEAEEALSAMEEHVASGLALAEPVADAVLPLEPADWPDPARAVIEQGKEDLNAAREEFRSARNAALRVVEILRELLGRD